MLTFPTDVLSMLVKLLATGYNREVVGQGGGGNSAFRMVVAMENCLDKGSCCTWEGFLNRGTTILVCDNDCKKEWNSLY